MTEAKPILHSIAGSRSFRVLWLLCELGVDVDLQPYQITDGSLQQDAFKVLSPARRVPALEIDGITLIESGATVQYLCETRMGHSLMPAVGDPERAEWLQWIHYSETLGVAIQNLNMQHLFLPDPAMRSIPVMGIETKRLAIALKALEARLADGRDFLLASGFSSADVMMGFTVTAASHYVHFDVFPRLVAYQDRLAERPAYRQAQQMEGPQQFYTRDFYELPQG
jgi:glutathione S-transferase